ncbi:MAG TPA: VTT domain-containing protein [Chitinophagaceae bacterium]|nr:VTT domain-containing protein [Chitinophagaceae bacterium]
MHWSFLFIESLKHLLSPRWVVHHGGLFLLMLIIFAETGLFAGFFLPGDSLLFVAGMLATRKDSPFSISFILVILLVSLAGILGNFAGYWFGQKSGHLLFQRGDRTLFKKKHLIAAHEFYEKHGGSAVIFARFIPFIRTFVPIVAGIAEMDYRKFGIYNVLGSTAWVCSLMVAGYFLGRAFPWLGGHLEGIVLVIALLSVAPILLKFMVRKRKPATPERISSP